ncbi:RING-H2 finger protein ATL2-like [Magnolia sinica]|uniref:RING-H2 finger protein ATL2-like n=1 Tax=Magnolia sinica TaxID=86752 RepID=UPI0026586BCC|nr:RING-H2 finger protein ATL2-like [Magnolia sinica]
MSTPSYPSIPPSHYQDMYPFNGKIMVFAVALLLVITSLVLLLHVYAKWWFFRHSQGRRLSIPDLPSFSQLQRLSIASVDNDAHVIDGLDSSVIASLPSFVYKPDSGENGMECVVCLSMLEEDDKGRILPNCQHAFHADCIDMWLLSRSTCPICRNVVAGPEELVIGSMVQELGQEPSQTSVVSAVAHGSDGNSPLEIGVEMPTDSRYEAQTSKDFSSSSSSSSSTLGESLRRMLSRSRSECRVFPSAHVNESHGIV